MKYLGIDYGTKRIGLAVSDDSGQMAFPLKVVPVGKNYIQEILAEIKSNNIESIIIGESKNYQGQENAVMTEIKKFIEILKKEINLPIHLEPEFMTSAQAERGQGKNAMLDASAATIILQSFLDKR